MRNVADLDIMEIMQQKKVNTRALKRVRVSDCMGGYTYAYRTYRQGETLKEKVETIVENIICGAILLAGSLAFTVVGFFICSIDYWVDLLFRL